MQVSPSLLPVLEVQARLRHSPSKHLTPLLAWPEECLGLQESSLAPHAHPPHEFLSDTPDPCPSQVGWEREDSSPQSPSPCHQLPIQFLQGQVAVALELVHTFEERKKPKYSGTGGVSPPKARRIWACHSSAR